MDQEKATEQPRRAPVNPNIKQDLHEDLPYNLIRVPVKYLGDIWSYIGPMIEKGESVNPNLTRSALIDGLIDQSIQLWVVMPSRLPREVIAVFFTSIERDIRPDGTAEWVLSLFGLGGTAAREWVSICHQKMHEYARIEGCKRVRMCGRPAWQRILPGYAVVGEKQGHLIYERAVE